jgi:hypothetical protein
MIEEFRLDLRKIGGFFKKKEVMVLQKLTEKRFSYDVDNGRGLETEVRYAKVWEDVGVTDVLGGKILDMKIHDSR